MGVGHGSVCAIVYLKLSVAQTILVHEGWWLHDVLMMLLP